jgi:DMSO/TMAO reductase YedYZ heme-binding membrane subunit
MQTSVYAHSGALCVYVFICSCVREQICVYCVIVPAEILRLNSSYGPVQTMRMPRQLGVTCALLVDPHMLHVKHKDLVV